MEQWVDVKGFEDYYQVSSLGRLKSKPRLVKRKDGRVNQRKEKVITPIWLDRKGGYYVVALIVDGIRHNLWLSQLMVRSFIGEPPETDLRPMVEFINGDNRDYRIVNMRWQDRAVRNEEIREKFANGSKGTALAYEYGLHQTCISTICKDVSRMLHLPEDIDGEEWRKVDELLGDIYVSNMGRVYAHTRPDHYDHRHTNVVYGLLTPQKNKLGYMQLILRRRDGRKKTYRIHRLVAMAFCDGYNPMLVVDHINNDKTDNRASNLRWVTNAFNTQRAGKAFDYVPDIRRMHSNNMTVRQIADIIGLHTETVRQVVKGVTYRGI